MQILKYKLIFPAGLKWTDFFQLKLLGPFCQGPSHDPLTADEQLCCTSQKPCREGTGICENDEECQDFTKCEKKSCKEKFQYPGSNWGDDDACCVSNGLYIFYSITSYE